MKKRKKSLPKIISILCLLLFIVSLSYAKVPDIVLNQKKAVVSIYINDKEGKQVTTGTGFIIDKNGIITTNYHVIEKWLEVLESTLLVKMENGAYFLIEELINFDEDNDVALFKVAGKELPMVKIVTEYKPKQGDSIVVIGSPMGLETTVSDGIISNVRGKGGLIQITAPVSMGSSGSPVFNLKGEAIGIATFLIEGGQNLNFAIPVKHVANLLSGSKKPKKKIKPALEPAPAPEAPAPAPSREPVDELEKAKAEVRKNPDSAEAHIWLGAAYGKLGMYREAVEAFKQAIRIKPTFEDAHVGIGLVYDSLGMYSEAIEAYKQAIRIKPDHAEAHFGLGLAYDELEMYKEAIEAYKQAIRFKPDFEEAHYYLGLAYNSLEMYREAIDAFKQAIRIKPDLSYAHYNLGLAYSNLGMHREAVEAYKQAIRIKPDFAEAHYNLGGIYLILNDRGSALDEYKILKDLDPESANELFNLIYK